MSLREITKELHADAERTIFAKKLVTGTFTKDEYANYLWQMVLVYNGIESAAKSQGMLKNLPDIERTHKIYQDCIELVSPNHNLKWLRETIEYYQYLLELNHSDRKHLVKAHLYCRHMGDLFGGQIIAKQCPGSGRFYQFKDAENLKTAIRAELTDDLGDEAKVAFQWAIKIMKALTKDE
jgi:heme oxygenase (biliverdin-producing, ferredoxin)